VQNTFLWVTWGILYYGLHGVFYILSCMVFDFTLRLFIFSRFSMWPISVSYIICIFLYFNHPANEIICKGVV
jgi:hypothetical protein